MTSEEFDKIVEQRINVIKESLLSKSKEYAREGERLHNFKTGARIANKHPAEVCIGFWLKHIVSLLDLIEDLCKGDHTRLGLFDEKITNATNYLILLETIVKETEEYKLANRIPVSARTVVINPNPEWDYPKVREDEIVWAKDVGEPKKEKSKLTPMIDPTSGKTTEDPKQHWDRNEMT